MSDEPPVPYEGRITCCLGLLLAVFVIGAILGFGYWDYSRHSKSRAAQLAGHWERSEMAGAVLEVPFKLEDRPDAAQLMLDSTDSIVSATAWEGQEDMNARSVYNLRIGLHRAEYKTGIMLDAEGAIHGAISHMAARAGVAIPEYAVSTLRVSNLDARKATCHIKIRAVDLRVDVLAVARGRTMWIVQTFLMDPEMAPQVDRVMASLEILPP